MVQRYYWKKLFRYSKRTNSNQIKNSVNFVYKTDFCNSWSKKRF